MEESDRSPDSMREGLCAEGWRDGPDGGAFLLFLGRLQSVAKRAACFAVCKNRLVGDLDLSLYMCVS